MATLGTKERAILLSRGGMSTDVIAGVLGVDQTDVHRLMLDDDPSIDLPGTSELSVFRTSVDVSYDEMVTLPSEAVEIVPDPGEGQMLAPFCAILQVSESFGSWDISNGPESLRLLSSSGAIALLSPLKGGDSQIRQLFRSNGGAILGILQGTADVISSQTYGYSAALAPFMAGALMLKVDGFDGDFPPLDEGGYPDAVLRVTAIYSIIDIA